MQAVSPGSAASILPCCLAMCKYQGMRSLYSGNHHYDAAQPIPERVLSTNRNRDKVKVHIAMGDDHGEIWR